MPRRFSGRQRVALWLYADGKCEACGVELDPSWHADHVHPWSLGGQTDVINGAALCPSCNIKKSNQTNMEAIMNRPDPRERWQNEAVESFVEREDDFLVTATPGAGKTRMALLGAQRLLANQDIERIIVVVPTLNLRKQWSKAAHSMKLDLTADYDNSTTSLTAPEHGVVVTYQQVCASPDLWRKHANQKNTLVILDEIHHAGDESTWGQSLKNAFGMAQRRLMLSGTPFRTDNRPIPFVRYDENGMSISDAGIDLRTAVKRGVVRSVKFEVLDGEATIQYDEDIRTTKMSMTDEYNRNTVWRGLREPDKHWIASAMRKADDELTRIRYEVPNAAGIVYAASIDHARQYAKLMGVISGERAVVVHSDMDNDPNTVIEEFAQSDRRWIVAAKMVSEGVDIPRAIVGVYASDIKTEMWFRQVVGRHVRKMDGDQGQTAKLFIPDHAELREIADRIQDEANVPILEHDLDLRDGTLLEPIVETSMVNFLASSEAVTSCVIYEGQNVDGAEIRIAEQHKQKTGLSHLDSCDVALLFRSFNKVGSDSNFRLVAQSAAPQKVMTPDDRRRELREKIQKKVATLARKRGGDKGDNARDINAELMREFGVKRAEADIECLELQLATVKNWINNETDFQNGRSRVR